MQAEAARSSAAPQARLMLLLLLAPALIWLVGLIVLPHIELAVLSLRERVAPRQYHFSMAQYRTFIEEPLYWHTFVRTAALSILATLMTLLLAFPIAWTIANSFPGKFEGQTIAKNRMAEKRSASRRRKYAPRLALFFHHILQHFSIFATDLSFINRYARR